MALRSWARQGSEQIDTLASGICRKPEEAPSYDLGIR
jgi:hypothetical protein